MLPQAHAYTDTVEPFARILRAAIAEEEAAGNFNALTHLLYERLAWGQIRALGYLPAGVAA